MNTLMVLSYFTCFACIAGGAFALMWSNLKGINWDKPSSTPKHPETPQAGDELLYVDFSREKLEELYRND